MKDLSRLVWRQYNNDKNKKYFCQYCLHGCTREEVLKNDMENCKLHGAQKIKFPEAGDKKGRNKVKLQKTANYVYLLSSTRISKAHYVNKMHMSHLHESPSPPNANIRYHVGDASTWRAMCITASGNILASGNISLKLFMEPLETIELLTF